MGDLPASGVPAASRAFVNTGVDYAGRILVRTAPGHSHNSHKSYIALFASMMAKTLHLELALDYSTAAFLAAFQRFVSRRGRPQSMYSDNGTNFQGADRELCEAHRSAIRDLNFLNNLAVDKVEWHFWPPAAPHFGEHWEAGVRNVPSQCTIADAYHRRAYRTTLLDRGVFEFATNLCRARELSTTTGRLRWDIF